MEKKMENEMETREYIGVILAFFWGGEGDSSRSFRGACSNYSKWRTQTLQCIQN